MVTLEQIKIIKDQHLNTVLLVAQAAMPDSQFHAFRKIVLDEFGTNGFMKELERIGSGRNRSSKEGVHHD